MRTAEEWIKFAKSQPDEMQTKWATETIPYGDLILMLNEARKECLEEAANRAVVLMKHLEKSDINLCTHTVDKQSILSLINELK